MLIPRRLKKRITQGVALPILLLLLFLGSFLFLQTHHSRSIKRAEFSAQIHLGSLKNSGFSSRKHPVVTLYEEAADKYQRLISSQSATLDQAIAKYKRKFNRSPPKGFDLWFQAAKKEELTIIDDYDIITKSTDPYWNVPPAVLRHNIERVNTDRQWIKDVTIIKGRPDYTPPGEVPFAFFETLPGQLEPYTSVLSHIETLHLLTNDFAHHDLPRVIQPYNTPALTATAEDRGFKWESNFSVEKQPGDVFHWINLQDQFTWDILKLACPPGSPIWAADPSPFQPKVPRILTDIGVAESKELCLHPRYRFQHGIWSPNDHKLTFEPVPILSGAKTSLHSDILIPSVYYGWSYDDQEITNWRDKINALYWAGSTTGAHLFEPLDWHSVPAHRHRFVEFVNDLFEGDSAPDNYSRPITLLDQPVKRRGSWQTRETTISEQIEAGLYNVRFTADPQCLDQPTCSRQRAYFHIGGYEYSPEHLKHRFLFDIDGNGLSGRFYRLLRSNATVFKVTLFQEWHDDFLIPWYHYVPVSVGMEELPELMRFFAQTEEGSDIAEKIAINALHFEATALGTKNSGAGWARMLLELHRLLGDGRDDGKLDIFQ